MNLNALRTGIVLAFFWLGFVAGNVNGPAGDEPGPIEQLQPDSNLESLEGVWLVVSDTYDGACVIRSTGPTYFFHFVTGFAKEGKVSSSQSSGVGIRTGDSLSVAWVQSEKTIGLTVYRLRGKTLEGRWTPIPGGQVGTEKLHLLRSFKD